jgi:PKD repeat protein
MSPARTTFVCIAILTLAPSVRAATYFAVSDEDLVLRTPIAVLARATSSSVVPADETVAETWTTFQVESVARGVASATIRVALPGGTLPDGRGSYFWMPQFQAGAEYVLFLYPRDDGAYGVTEFEMGIFGVYRDGAGNSFAMRERLQAGGVVPLGTSVPAHLEAPRQLGLFLDFISRFPAGSGDYWAAPNGPLTLSLQPTSGSIVPLWSNLTGSLFRWESFSGADVGYVDDDTSDEATKPPGPQTGVVGGGLSEIQAAVATWNNDSSSTISYHYAGAGSNAVSIDLDNVSQFGGSGIPCSLGTIGLGGVNFSGSHVFKGESYMTITGGNIWMRRWDCTSSSYLNSAFQNAVTHELGHVLGLGHPDTDNSPHDLTPNDISGALMISLGQYTRPTGLGSDDIEGVCYLYGTCTGAAAGPVAKFTFSPSSPQAGATVNFTDLSSGSPSSWSWNFGDPGSGPSNTSSQQNPSHLFSASGHYSVQLSVASGNGSNQVAKTVTVSAPGSFPVAAFGFSPSAPSAGATVVFVDQSSGVPTSWAWNFGDPGSGFANSSSFENPTHVYANPGNYVAKLTASNSLGSNSVSVLVSVLGSTAGCTPNSTTLCLNGGRFLVQVAWQALNLTPATSGVGQGVSLTPDTGYFWFFTASNVELVVKVVDGRSFNGSFWVFYGALSNVSYTISVTDTLAGTVKTYRNPQNQLASVADTSAFPQAASEVTAPAGPSPGEAYREFSVSLPSLEGNSIPEATSPCASATRLCLNNSRFRVDVSWRAEKLTPPQSGAGQAVGLTPDTGYFWFFSSGNVELAIKVVDGRAFNGKFWVIYGALSNVEYTVTVTDTLTGSTRVYQNPQDSLASVADTAAF